MQVILEQDAFVALHLSQHVRYEAAVSFHESHTRQIERVVLKVIQVERLNILKRDAEEKLTDRTGLLGSADASTSPVGVLASLQSSHRQPLLIMSLIVTNLQSSCLLSCCELISRGDIAHRQAQVLI